MARRKLFTRVRSPEDAGPSMGEKPERDPQFPDDGQAGGNEPSPDFPPSEIAAGDLSEQAAEGERPRDSKNRDARTRSIRPPTTNLSLVRRERRALLRERERRIRDLGGLLLEMYRRDQFREDLIVEHCAQAMGVENRIHELESILTRASSGRAMPGPQCACGAPLLFGARFCASCGRPTELAAEGEKCARCGQPLALGASFCANCGATAGEAEDSRDASEQTMEHAPPPEAKDAVERVGDGEA